MLFKKNKQKKTLRINALGFQDYASKKWKKSNNVLESASNIERLKN